MFRRVRIIFSRYDNYRIHRSNIHFSLKRNQGVVINGRKIADNILSEIKSGIDEFIGKGHRPPHLTALLVGKNPASESYIKIKLKAAAKVGITVETVRCDKLIDERGLIQKIQELNRNPNVNGILVQLPVPGHMKERNVCNEIAPLKDVDGFTIHNIGRLCLNMVSMIPCTALAVEHIIKSIGFPTVGKSAVVCGRSKNVGMPIAVLLHSQGSETGGGLDATTTICHRYTPKEELKRLTKSADIVVSCAGVPGLITRDMVKEGACVIDIGMTRLQDEITKKATFVGDVDFDDVVKVAGYITPVPGGVGPITVAMLMRNTFLASKIQIQNNLVSGR